MPRAYPAYSRNQAQPRYNTETATQFSAVDELIDQNSAELEFFT